MIKAVVFDWGGVLTDPPMRAVLALEAELGFAPMQLVDWLAHTGRPVGDCGGTPEDDFALLEKGLISFDDYSTRVLERAAEHLGAPMDAATWARVRDTFVADPGVTAVHWVMVDRARRLREDGYRTAILTNQLPTWTGWRETVPTAEFDLVVDSSEVGLRKPEPAAWQYMCDGLGVAPHEAVLLDDWPRNIAGAEAFGMVTILVRDPVSAIAELDALLAL